MRRSARGLWFKAKRYGWGWYPITWQGWTVLIAVLISGILPIWLVDRMVQHKLDISCMNDTPFAIYTNCKFEDKSDYMWFYVWAWTWLVLMITVLMVICYQKGETPRWRWGGKK